LTWKAVTVASVAVGPDTCTVSPVATAASVALVVAVTVVDDVVVTVSEPDAVFTVSVPALLAVTSPKILGLVSVPLDAEAGYDVDDDGAGTMARAVAAKLPSLARVPSAST
jgi:hypothetical protein